MSKRLSSLFTDSLNEVKITLIAGGSHHIIAVSSDNTIYSWGTCKYGALGLGNQIFSSVPTKVQSPLFGMKIQKIACAQDCTFLLLENGEVLAAGRNSDNKLGIGENNLKSMVFVRLIGKFLIIVRLPMLLLFIEEGHRYHQKSTRRCSLNQSFSFPY